MKDLVLNFSWAQFLALPPTEMLAFVVMAGVALFLSLLMIGAVLAFAVHVCQSIYDGLWKT